MGAYINPRKVIKEKWLDKYAIELNREPENITEAGENMLPVCLIDNLRFTAAGIAFSEEELEVFKAPSDTRPKRWFFAPKDKLYEVSNLNQYLPQE